MKIFKLLIVLAVVYECQAQSFWSQLKAKLPWHFGSDQESETVISKAQKLAGQSKEYAEKIAEKLWTSGDTDNLACRAKDVAAKTMDTAQLVAGLAKDAALKATEKGKEASSYAAEQLTQIAKDAACYASDTARKAGAKGRETAEQMTDTAIKLSAGAQAAVDAIGSFAQNVSSDLKNFALDFGNCTSENTTCKRCQKIKIGMLGIDDEICITLTYLPDEYALTTSVDLGRTNLYKSTYSLSNPPPICFVPTGFDNIANICLIFSQLSVDKDSKQLHGCLSLRSSLFYNSIDKSYTKDLGCFTLG